MRFSDQSYQLLGSSVRRWLRRLWYFSEELIPVAPSLKRFLTARRTYMPLRSVTFPPPLSPSRSLLFHPSHVSETSALSDFVGPRAILLFHLLGESHTFLAKEEWWLLPQYEDIWRSLQNLTPLSDSCERALAFATRLNGAITRQEDSWQELVRVVAKHQELFLCFTRKI